MADNTTTYTTIIDTQVKGEDQIKDLGDATEDTEVKFKSLKSQIRETTVALQKLADEGKEGSKEFKQLSDKLDDLGDSQKRVAFQSGQIEDKLSALPGPLGAIGKGFGSLKDSIDTFGKATTISLGIVGLLVAAFFAIKEALGKTKEGQEGLSKAFSAFNTILAPIYALLEKIGLAILPIVTKGFEVLGSVMSKVAKFFGATDDKIKEVHGSLEKNNELVQKTAEANAKAAEELKKQKEEEAKKHLEILAKKKAADEKAEAERKKKAEELAKLQAEASKVLTDAYIVTLAQRDQELFKAGQAHNERMLALEKAGIKDKTSVLEQYRIETDAINKKFDDEALKKKEEADKKADDDRKKADEDAKKLAEDKLKVDNTARDDKSALLTGEFNEKRANNEATFEDEMNLFDRTRQLGKETMEANKASDDAIAAYDAETAAVRIQIEKAQQAAKLAIISDALGSVADLVGRDTVAGKALAIGQAIINTYLGATAALAASPPPFNFIAAGAVIATGLMNVKKIIETKLPGVEGGGAGGAAAGPLPSMPSIPSMNAPRIETTGGANPTAQIADTLAASSGKPIRAFVVSQEISSQQVLDRKTARAATFS